MSPGETGVSQEAKMPMFKKMGFVRSISQKRVRFDLVYSVGKLFIAAIGLLAPHSSRRGLERVF